MFQRKIAFTLAEIMIVLTIIGVLTAILLPIANHSRPDENVMKFKKADTTLKNVIRELVNSDKYYADGDLGTKFDGSLVISPTYLCETIADMVSTKSVKCSSTPVKASGYGYGNHINMEWMSSQGKTLQYMKEFADNICKINTSAGEEIVLADGIIIYQTTPGTTFGSYHCSDAQEVYYPGDNPPCTDRLFANNNFHSGSSSDFDTVYKPICIDIDGINKGEAPFGYGIRADGKIFTGARADEWMEKGFQKGANDN